MAELHFEPTEFMLRQMLRAENEERERRGLRPFTLDELVAELEAAADDD